ncbi:MAG: toxin [Gammaproteobacteria bacterium]|nr:MAG: toxin [Gammaproteobacteria bacterium]
MATFEYDENKSKSNLKKHGIDFNTAQVLWNDPDALEVEIESGVETRFLVVGLINNKHWSAIVTYRNKNVRLISVRRSRNKEVELYES